MEVRSTWDSALLIKYSHLSLDYKKENNLNSLGASQPSAKIRSLCDLMEKHTKGSCGVKSLLQQLQCFSYKHFIAEAHCKMYITAMG